MGNRRRQRMRTKNWIGPAKTSLWLTCRRRLTGHTLNRQLRALPKTRRARFGHSDPVVFRSTRLFRRGSSSLYRDSEGKSRRIDSSVFWDPSDKLACKKPAWNRDVG